MLVAWQDRTSDSRLLGAAADERKRRKGTHQRKVKWKRGRSVRVDGKVGTRRVGRQTDKANGDSRMAGHSL